MKVRELFENDDWDDNTPQFGEDQIAEKIAAIRKEIEAIQHSVEFNEMLLNPYREILVYPWQAQYDMMQTKYQIPSPAHKKGELPIKIPQNTQNAEKIIHVVTKAMKQIAAGTAQIKNLITRENQIKKQFRDKQFANVGTANVSTQQIEAAKKQDPIVIGKSKIANPLNQYPNDPYVGPPNQYPDLTGSQKDLYLDIKVH